MVALSSGKHRKSFKINTWIEFESPPLSANPPGRASQAGAYRQLLTPQGVATRFVRSRTLAGVIPQLRGCTNVHTIRKPCPSSGTAAKPPRTCSSTGSISPMRRPRSRTTAP